MHSPEGLEDSPLNLRLKLRIQVNICQEILMTRFSKVDFNECLNLQKTKHFSKSNDLTGLSLLD